MYLKARESIVLNYNPFIAFAADPNPSQMSQVNNYFMKLKLLVCAILFILHFMPGHKGFKFSRFSCSFYEITERKQTKAGNFSFKS